MDRGERFVAYLFAVRRLGKLFLRFRSTVCGCAIELQCSFVFSRGAEQREERGSTRARDVQGRQQAGLCTVALGLDEDAGA